MFEWLRKKKEFLFKSELLFVFARIGWKAFMENNGISTRSPSCACAAPHSSSPGLEDVNAQLSTLTAANNETALKRLKYSS